MGWLWGEPPRDTPGCTGEEMPDSRARPMGWLWGEPPRDTHGYTGEEMPEVEPDLWAGSGGSSQSVRLAVLGKRCRK